MPKIIFTALAALFITAGVVAQTPKPQPNTKPKCDIRDGCWPTCPTDDPNGCGIFGSHLTRM